MLNKVARYLCSQNKALLINSCAASADLNLCIGKMSICFVMMWQLSFQHSKQIFIFLYIILKQSLVNSRNEVKTIKIIENIIEPNKNTNEPPRGKTNNVVSEQVRHKPTCTVAEKS